jgi:hypothetical protein
MAQSALFSSSVLSSAASGHRLPTLQVTLAFVAACQGDTFAWEQRWRRVSGATQASASLALLRHQQAREEVAPPTLLPAGPALAPPAQLPRRSREFSLIRERAVQVVTEPTRDAMPLLISGPMGVGKTQLAIRLAHELSSAMPDGQLYADFGEAGQEQRSADSVLTGFLTALCGTHRLPNDPSQRVTLYRSLLATKRVLVLLDNVVDEGQVRPFLTDSSGSALIIASRSPLLGLSDIQRLGLTHLTRAGSLALLHDILGQQALDEPNACDRLAAACGDLPLALEVAARRLKSRPHWSIGQVVSRVCETGGFLNWLCIGDVSVRDRLLDAYEGLSRPAQHILHDLGRSATSDGDLVMTPRLREVNPLLAEEILEELTQVGMLRRKGWGNSYWIDPLTQTFLQEHSPSGDGRAHASLPAEREASGF